MRQARIDLARHSARLPSQANLKTWKQRFDDLEAAKEAIEVKLTLQSEAFRRQRQKPTARAIATALSEDTALVEFLVYSHATPLRDRKGEITYERRLLAWVLRKDQAPVLVRLGVYKEIEQAIQRWRTSVTTGGSKGADAQAAALLRERIWLPVSKHLSGAKLVLLAPDGELNNLPFGALPASAPDRFLLEEMTFAYVTSGRQLLLGEPEDPSAKGLLALGGLDFGKSPARADLPPRFPAWPVLPGAEREARQISELFTRLFPREQQRLLHGDRVDKAALLEAMKQRPAWLHLTTHAYFDPPPPTAAAPHRQDDLGRHPIDEVAWRTFGRNPLLVSGLVLSGANASEEKGLLTAEEVTDLDLSGVRLAVLSACQTAQGKQAGWQGVQGLQRAFHEAGARHLLASLWSVNDAATSVLMEEFYHNLWGKNLSPIEALRQAQITVMKHPERVEKRADEVRLALLKQGVDEKLLAQRGFAKEGGTADVAAPALAPKGGRSPIAWWAPWILSGAAR